jgi:trimethylamine--corrinoid protein Co-methyltransferase
MKLSIIEVLTRDEVKRIDEATMQLLEEVGIVIQSPETKEIFLQSGATLRSEDENRVLIPTSLIKEQLKKVPKKFSLYGPDGRYSMNINLESLHFGTFGAAINTFDPSRKKLIRKSKLKEHLKIVNCVDNISCSHLDVWPSDVPFTEMHCHLLREWARYSIKPFGMSCYGKTASSDMMKMISIITGDEAEVLQKPRLIGIFNPISPLLLPQIQLNGLMVFSKYKQPLLISASSAAGSTAPVTLAGSLTQANAEVLSTITLSQLINPGSPVFYASTNTIMDPGTGHIAYGAIEMGLLTIASAQMARYYRIPSKGSGALTESKCFDMQNGFERLMGLSCAVNAGHNYITCAGTYETALSEALELLLIDNELIGVLKRAREGISVNDDTIALEEIKKIALTTRNYLGTKHSVKNTRKEFYIPKLIDRDKRGKWIQEGSLTIDEKARRRVSELLDAFQGPGLSVEKENDIDAFIKQVSKRTLNDYKRLEGISEKTKINIEGMNF